MEKIGERIGLYDLWVVFFPGLVGMLELSFFYGVFWSLYSEISLLTVLVKILPNNMSIWIVIIVISFFLGIVFQEVGRGVRKMTNYRSAMDGLLDPAVKVLTEKERANFRSILKKHGWDGESIEGSREIFHRINAEVQEYGIASKYVKLNILQNMSLTLSAVMLFGVVAAIILLIMSIINRRVHIVIMMIASICVGVVLMVLFFYRFKRYERYWVRNIMYAILTKNVGEERKNENTEGC